MGRGQGRTTDGGKREWRERKEGEGKERRVKFTPLPRKNSGYGLGTDY